jgi:type IV pilus assembly protein PilP
MILSRTVGWTALLTCLAAFAIACGSSGNKNAPGLAASQAAPPPTRGLAISRPEADGGADAAVKIEFAEQEFVETERNRDPFRSFAALFADKARQGTRDVQRDVVLDRYAIDDLKLVGIITGTAEPRAMFIDPTGKGWIVKRGQFIGREEVVHGKGPTGADYSLNWRVDRIREGDIVLVREDPAHSDVPPATRVVPLRPDSESASGR